MAFLLVVLRRPTILVALLILVFAYGLPCTADSTKLTLDEFGIAKDIKVDPRVLSIIKDYLHSSAVREVACEPGKNVRRLCLDILPEDRASALQICTRYPELKPLVDLRLKDVAVENKGLPCQTLAVHWVVSRNLTQLDPVLQNKLHDLGYELLLGCLWPQAKVFADRKAAEAYLAENDSPVLRSTLVEQEPEQREIIFPIDWRRKDYSEADKAMIVRQSWPVLAHASKPQQHFEAVNVFREREFSVSHPENEKAFAVMGQRLYSIDPLTGFELRMPDGAVVRRPNVNHWRFDIPARFAASAVQRVARLRPIPTATLKHQ